MKPVERNVSGDYANGSSNMGEVNRICPHGLGLAGRGRMDRVVGKWTHQKPTATQSKNLGMESYRDSTSSTRPQRHR